MWKVIADYSGEVDVYLYSTNNDFNFKLLLNTQLLGISKSTPKRFSLTLWPKGDNKIDQTSVTRRLYNTVSADHCQHFTKPIKVFYLCTAWLPPSPLYAHNHSEEGGTDITLSINSTQNGSQLQKHWFLSVSLKRRSGVWTVVVVVGGHKGWVRSFGTDISIHDMHGQNLPFSLHWSPRCTWSLCVCVCVCV